jgi:tetratricopeptide (TPR) repeat protein
MSSSNTFEHARALEAGGHLDAAERAYKELSTAAEHRESALVQLADLYRRAGQLKEAATTLLTLVEEHPDSLNHCDRSAMLFSDLGQVGAAIKLYEKLIERQPKLAEAHYNIALLYKKQRNYRHAIAAYEQAVALGISDVHEVYTNMGVLYSDMRQPDKACGLFEKALEVRPAYIPALFNLASQLEELGQRDRAIGLYEHILDIDADNWNALARIAYARRLNDKDDALIDRLVAGTTSDIVEPLVREGLYFALGKALDDVGRYDEAMAAYTSANELGKLRSAPYDAGAVEERFDQLIADCDADWIDSRSTALDAAPVFICGMFRSGSTLVEQILGAHAAVTAGGELDILPWLLASKPGAYPERLDFVSPADVERLAVAYLSRLEELFPGAKKVTDKRPDNHMHLGLIKAMFPAVRIVYTVREPRDNCLSIYFQQLTGDMAYANDLGDTAHYIEQQARLLDHWRECFDDNIFIVEYDELVRSPKPVVSKLLDFVGLEWDEACLNFQQADVQVKTASVWQVREKLHEASSGRWRNYESATKKMTPGGNKPDET